MQVTDVKRLADEVRAGDPSLTDAQVLQGLRTRVHEALQAEQPPPYTLPAEAPGKTHAEFAARYKAGVKAGIGESALTAIHDEELMHLAERKAAMLSGVTAAEQMAFQKWKATTDGRAHPFIRDAHHYAQFEHGRNLWKQTDALVAQAGVQ